MLTPEAVEVYEKNGMIEDFDEYIKYKEEDNYGRAGKKEVENMLID